MTALCCHISAILLLEAREDAARGMQSNNIESNVYAYVYTRVCVCVCFSCKRQGEVEG
jgi:hypothetical protein